ncbi:LPXTG-motif cell wall-anchored protein [Paenibacillus endophyticus]|uniref:LPXTG-motif cell wall-anchored protein n=1 Tax=Paenibacillus endophyticus TaxID=1294268 RepID=A0A7W5CDA1_9BACL|nr:hypothetical protein [Paenibacillus endophyticus]MBB3155039.1 LPXTG-motif cell wall-anchored protein [Paenibacillus endophyticus]
MFQPQNFLLEAVSKNDIEQVRVALSTYLSKNPTNEQNEVIHAAEYSESRLSEQLWVQHDDMFIEKDSMKWTTDYLGQLKSDLRYNFSKERFMFIIEVGKKVRPYKGKISPSQTFEQPLRSTAPHSTPKPTVSRQDPIPEQVVDTGKSNTKWLVIAGLGGLVILAIAIILITQNQK